MSLLFTIIPLQSSSSSVQLFIPSLTFSLFIFLLVPRLFLNWKLFNKVVVPSSNFEEP